MAEVPLEHAPGIMEALAGDIGAVRNGRQVATWGREPGMQGGRSLWLLLFADGGVARVQVPERPVGLVRDREPHLNGVRDMLRVDGISRSWQSAVAGLSAPPWPVYGTVTCTADVELEGEEASEDEYGRRAGRPCGNLSRYIVARSDGDPSYGAHGGTEEACEAHLAGTADGMVDGDHAIKAVVTIRWDPPEAS